MLLFRSITLHYYTAVNISNAINDTTAAVNKKMRRPPASQDYFSCTPHHQ